MLEYAYNALEPYIDAKTMEIHHTKHHQTYIDKLNAALQKYPELQTLSAEELIKDLSIIPEDVRTAVRNHGGGHSNHSFFWKIMSPQKDQTPSGKLLEQINKDFGSYEKFKEQFTTAALGVFGSGWAWLVKDGKKLAVMTTPNQDSPLSQGKIPILGIDVWEHAYYVRYFYKRIDYIGAFFNIINWHQVEKNYQKS
jgi:Fe-Mn family superoxide dismutase